MPDSKEPRRNSPAHPVDTSSNPESEARNSNAVYQTAKRAAARRCRWIPLALLVALVFCLAMFSQTAEFRWLLGALTCPLVLIVLLVILQWSALRRHWVCPQCGHPLPLLRDALLVQIKYTACCPHCGYNLESAAPAGQTQPEEAAGTSPSPASEGTFHPELTVMSLPVPASPWPTRICGTAGLVAAVLILFASWKTGSSGPFFWKPIAAVVCLLMALMLLFCRPSRLPESIHPTVMVRECRWVVWFAIPMWLIGIITVLAGAAAPQPDGNTVALVLLVGVLFSSLGAWCLLDHHNRALYLWEENSVTRLAYSDLWGRLRCFDAGQIVSVRLTVNKSVHLLDANGKKLAAVETMMPGFNNLQNWLKERDQMPVPTPAMKKATATRNRSAPEPLCWKEEYRTRWHNHLNEIRFGMWGTVVLLGLGGILPAALYLKGVLSFMPMIWLITLAPIPFFVICFRFSPVLLFEERVKPATDEWRAMHIKAPSVLLLWFTLPYIGQVYFLWSRWIMQVAEPGLAWGIQSVLLAALLIALFARLTPRRLRQESVMLVGLLLIFFSTTFVYGANLMLSGPVVHSPLVILGSHAADPTDNEDLSTLTIQLADGSETTLNVLDNTYKAALSGEELVLCQRKSPLGIVFVGIHRPDTHR